MTNVYFATNRKKDGTGKWGYGAQSVPHDTGQITFAVASVSGLALPDETSGTIDTIDKVSPGDFAAGVLDELVNAQKDLLVFIHGFDNSFEDAIKRSAFNREWLADGGAQMVVLSFTWPSAGALFAAPPHMAPDAYLADQTQAGRSGFHLAYFLDAVARLRAGFLAANPQGRIVLLAHSMGNYALQAAIQSWFADGRPANIVFDEALLAAADEIDDSFERPNGGRLSELPKLASRITIYHSLRDIAMYLSSTVNLSRRLGYDGPARKHDVSIYPPGKFRIVNCTDVEDYDLFNPPDASHQYYRRSKSVRADILGAIRKDPALPAGITSLPG